MNKELLEKFSKLTEEQQKELLKKFEPKHKYEIVIKDNGQVIETLYPYSAVIATDYEDVRVLAGKCEKKDNLLLSTLFDILYSMENKMFAEYISRKIESDFLSIVGV